MVIFQIVRFAEGDLKNAGVTTRRVYARLTAENCTEEIVEGYGGDLCLEMGQKLCF